MSWGPTGKLCCSTDCGIVSCVVHASWQQLHCLPVCTLSSILCCCYISIVVTTVSVGHSFSVGLGGWAPTSGGLSCSQWSLIWSHWASPLAMASPWGLWSCPPGWLRGSAMGWSISTPAEDALAPLLLVSPSCLACFTHPFTHSETMYSNQ